MRKLLLTTAIALTPIVAAAPALADDDVRDDSLLDTIASVFDDDGFDDNGRDDRWDDDRDDDRDDRDDDDRDQRVDDRAVTGQRALDPQREAELVGPDAGQREREAGPEHGRPEGLPELPAGDEGREEGRREEDADRRDDQRIDGGGRDLAGREVARPDDRDEGHDGDGEAAPGGGHAARLSNGITNYHLPITTYQLLLTNYYSLPKAHP